MSGLADKQFLLSQLRGKYQEVLPPIHMLQLQRELNAIQIHIEELLLQIMQMEREYGLREVVN